MQANAGPFQREKIRSRIPFFRPKSPAAEARRRRVFLFPARGRQDNDREANEMRRAKENFARPYGLREFEFVRAGPDGAYWQRADGRVVRVAAPEGDRVQAKPVAKGGAARAEWEVMLER